MGSKLQPTNKLARTLLCHARSILNYFHYPITTGPLEGINKAGRPTRMAYGFRYVEFLHLKLYSLHEPL